MKNQRKHERHKIKSNSRIGTARSKACENKQGKNRLDSSELRSAHEARGGGVHGGGGRRGRRGMVMLMAAHPEGDVHLQRLLLLLLMLMLLLADDDLLLLLLSLAFTHHHLEGDRRRRRTTHAHTGGYSFLSISLSLSICVCVYVCISPAGRDLNTAGFDSRGASCQGTTSLCIYLASYLLRTSKLPRTAAGRAPGMTSVDRSSLCED